MQSTYQNYSHSAHEHAWEHEDVVAGCQFFLPTSFFLQLGRLRRIFGGRRKELNWRQFMQLTEYLTRLGILTQLTANGAVRHDLPSVHEVRATCSKNRYGYGVEYGKMHGMAYSVAIGELLERYFISSKKFDSESLRDLILKRYYPKVPITLFNSYLDEQIAKFPNLRRHSEETYDYTVCMRLSSGGKVVLPSQFCYFRDHNSAESFLVQSTTNGAGAYYSRTEAVLSGLCELIQRDNFLLMWLAKETRPLIDLVTLPQESGIAAFVKRATSRGLEVYFIDMARDISVHSIACVVVDRRGGVSGVGVGGAAGGNIDDCMNASLVEALCLLNKNLSDETPIDLATYKSFTNIDINRNARLTMWKGKHVSYFDFLFGGKKVKYSEYVKKNNSFQNKQEELDHLVRIVEEKGVGYEVYVREIRSRILSALGFHVVKVVVPALIPLYLDEALATLKSARLALALGVKQDELRISMLNPYPHPFP